MRLFDLRDYLMRVKIASLAHLAVYFNKDAEVLRGMLSHWVRCGRVRCFNKTAACGGPCQKCPSASVEIYEWLAVTS